MNVDFYDSHLQTLKDLQEMAEKHNCKIHFCFQSNADNDIDLDLLKDCGLTKKELKLIEDDQDVHITNIQSKCDKIWFELYDSNTKTYHTLSYLENSCNFCIRSLTIDWEQQQILEGIKERFEWGESDWGDNAYLSFSQSPTIIRGFGYKNIRKDGRVYRSGMALSFFAELVCKYLKEPKIERTY